MGEDRQASINLQVQTNSDISYLLWTGRPGALWGTWPFFSPQKEGLRCCPGHSIFWSCPAVCGWKKASEDLKGGPYGPRWFSDDKSFMCQGTSPHLQSIEPFCSFGWWEGQPEPYLVDFFWTLGSWSILSRFGCFCEGGVLNISPEWACGYTIVSSKNTRRGRKGRKRRGGKCT